jgi:hypothetical protein
MDRDTETLACALRVEKQYGENAALHVAEQIGRLSLADDQAGIAWWREIARILDQRMRQH